MKIMVKFQLKQNQLDWSNQVETIEIQNDTEICIQIQGVFCEINIVSDTFETAKDYLYLVWELLALYDGYFYKPLLYMIDEKKEDISSLIKTNMYVTDKKWISSAFLLGRNNRCFSEKIIKNYSDFRNKGRREQSMNRSMINSYFYLHSKAYKNVIIEHRLVLLMDVCDGLAREYLQGTKRGSSYNISVIVNRLRTKSDKNLGKQKFREGAALLDIEGDKAVNALQNIRDELTHFDLDLHKPSFGNYISDINHKTDNRANLYAFYFLSDAFRVALLETIGYNVIDDVKNYLLDEIIKWLNQKQ